MEPRDTRRAESTSRPREWRAADEQPAVARPGETPERGLRGFLRRLSVLFSLDPRSGSR
jgi:hypothetical protein